MNKPINIKNNRNNKFKHPKSIGNKQKAALEPAFEFAFLIIDLTGKTTTDKIIRINQILVDKNGDSTYSQHLFGNGNTPITQEAFGYHGITESMLAGKPILTAESFDFKQAKNIVVWDGKVTQTLLKRNNIASFSPIINLQALARYLEVEPKPIRLNDYALKSLSHKKYQVELMLRKPENKIKVLPEIFDYLQKRYNECYNESKVSFLVTVGKAPNKKIALASIATYMEKKEALNKQKEDYLKKHPSKVEKQPETQVEGKKVIKVVINQNKEQEKPKRKSHFQRSNGKPLKKS